MSHRRDVHGKSPLGRCHGRVPAGFTLTELLVVVVILGMLAALVFGALQAGRESARIARTRATIAKLHNIIMAQYESYRTRRVPVNTAGMTPPQAARITPQQLAEARLEMLRALMRLEMPERWTDVVFDPQNPLSNNPALGRPQPNPAMVTKTIAGTPPETVAWRVPWPTLAQRYYRTYLRQFQQADRDFKVINENAPAECLYLIVSASPENLAQFHENEIGDTDGDGLMEFLDGWGRPIYFLRWAPGFNDSDLQPNIPPMSPADAAKTDHDPLDSRRVDPAAWRLVPLIYSAGRDGQYDVAFDPEETAYVWKNDTYAQTFGEPTGSGFFDNIHNHRLEGE